ncbi:MAG: AMP-binding protein [Verrucomicrobiales bacterium]|nr:AMP-binding protein [Verrucomicrobiales bacterium]
MATPELNAASVWQQRGILVLQNPRALLPEPPPDLLPGGALLFATSGSTGQPKWILHSRETLLTSASAVNRRLQADRADTWLCCLPLFHVGGLAITARAHLSGSRVVHGPDKWCPRETVRTMEAERVTLTSLVPAQVHDLAEQGLCAPPALRAAIVGGGFLSPALADRAAELGWPLLPSYGLTEAASQVATATGVFSPLQILSHWETAVDDQGRLLLRGPALFHGSFVRNGESWQFHPQPAGGWFATADRVQLDGGTLHWLGRLDRTVKILGELVDLDALERELSALAGTEVAVISMPDERRGGILTICAESDLSTAVAVHQQRCAPFQRLGRILQLEALPRSPLGKIQRVELKDLAAAMARELPS